MNTLWKRGDEVRIIADYRTPIDGSGIGVVADNQQPGSKHVRVRWIDDAEVTWARADVLEPYEDTCPA